MVIVYTKNCCAACAATKRELTARGVPFEERNIEDSASNALEAMQTGYRSMPIVVTHQETWSGLQKDKLAKIADS